MDSTVTIGKSYFEALLRRAEFHTNEASDPLVTNNFVTLTNADHNYLETQAREYATLRNALLKGGLTPETLDLLISGAESEENDEEPGFHTNQGNQYGHRPPVAVTLTRSAAAALTPDLSDRIGNQGYPSHARNYDRSYSFGAADSGVTFAAKDEEPTGSGLRSGLPHNDQRTILFTNLSDKTTHKDITDLVRGGRLLDVYLRNDRCATVSFVEGAADFMAYAKRNDLYLNTKRVEVRWNDRQFRLPGHVANKIAAGATRNIVIRNGASKNLTERGIREDMEHIHNLVVISVKFIRQDVYISTNSVHNSLFARTCMMSRALYKGLKIEWYPDECSSPIPKIAGSLPAPPIPQRNSRASSGSLLQTTSQSKASGSNLYSLLDMDGSEEDDDESDADNTTTSQAAYPSNGVKINWADAAVVA
ncbi:hypothetical protein FKW77_002095 [Venturia effusa]|uniref:RRM domain-containing protein n=1 Tax=Venturia effusa TaxID=50376 RepID=A0A517LI77_9PEZI|nr:hypothetical protein FKW77_002095 [Venturia effusa]